MKYLKVDAAGAGRAPGLHPAHQPQSQYLWRRRRADLHHPARQADHRPGQRRSQPPEG
ncbi:MAG: hypothetical protein MZV64_59710 [Ignavibacteriales bacterium]|nr:hypothetical protein [Ignavibacteriales bacterium]